MAVLQQSTDRTRLEGTSLGRRLHHPRHVPAGNGGQFGPRQLVKQGTKALAQLRGRGSEHAVRVQSACAVCNAAAGLGMPRNARCAARGAHRRWNAARMDPLILPCNPQGSPRLPCWQPAPAAGAGAQRSQVGWCCSCGGDVGPNRIKAAATPTKKLSIAVQCNKGWARGTVRLVLDLGGQRVPQCTPGDVPAPSSAAALGRRQCAPALRSRHGGYIG